MTQVVQQAIISKLTEALDPMHLDVQNESDGHNVPKGSETHFRLVVVSAQFEGLSRVRRQQKVYSLLSSELEGPVHALAMQTFTPEEWEKKPTVAQSPPCAGGQD